MAEESIGNLSEKSSTAVAAASNEALPSPAVSPPELPDWGRVLIAGGTDWPTLGRKSLKPSEEHIDLVTPHILRDVAHERMKRVFSGHSASHAFFLNEHGDLFALGRNEHGQLGLPIISPPQPPPPQSSTSSLPSVVGGKAIYTATRLDRSVHFVPPLPASSEGDVLHVSCGRSHTVLCTRAGSAYAAGTNAVGQCGNKKTDGDLVLFRKIDAAPFVKEKDPVIQVGAGLTFSLLLTASGKVYAMGSCEKGQLGNGKTGEHFIANNKLAFSVYTEPLLVRALAEKKIVQISCGQQHSVALDDDGYCYVWGFGGYGRLGIGSADDQLLPVLVPQFARLNPITRVKDVIAGPTSTVIIDRQRIYWLTGKWKTTGDGGGGQGFMTFKYLPDMMGCRIQRAALGGVSLIAIADEEASMRGTHQATMNIAWGQNASNGELGLGYDKSRSSTKPLRCETLDGIAILDVACGQNTTYFVARNVGDAYAELPSHPAITQSQDLCLVCGQGESEEADDANALLECERCEGPWHLRCLDPPLDTIPDGEWHCPRCRALIVHRHNGTVAAAKIPSAAATKKRTAAQSSLAKEAKKVKAHP